MKFSKSHIQLTALVLSFVFTNTVLAAESTTAENKDSGAAKTISNAEPANNADTNTASPVVQADNSAADTISNDTQSSRQQMDERRQQAQAAQEEAYKRFLEQRKQHTAEFNNNIPADAQERHNEFLKQMEQRRALNINADLTNDAASDTASPVAQTDSNESKDNGAADTISNDTQSYGQKMDERRQQAQAAQEEAYKRFLEQRKQHTAEFNNNIPAEAQERHNEFIKQMEQRRALNINADLTNDAGSDTASPVAQNADSETATPVAQADTAVSGQQVSQPQTINVAQSYRQQMDERRQQAQAEQLEAYKHFLERRKENTAAFNSDIPADLQERRTAFVKQMEERRALNIKMMEQHRKAAEERRAEMQLKMHRTSTTPELANEA